MDLFQTLEKKKQKEELRKQKTRDAIKAEFQSRGNFKDEEEKIFDGFRRRYQGERFIKLEHVDSLNLEYDVLFVSSIKNIGKTRNIVFDRFHYYYIRGKKVVYMRTSLTEFENHVAEFNNSPFNPFYAIKKLGQFILVHKETKEECGICIDMKKCNSISGGEFLDYGAVIFDEALTWSAKVEVNEAHIFNLFALFSSIQRSKKEKIKVYFTSNLPPTNKNLILLEYLNIDIDDELRYIVRTNPENPDVSCKILYLNVENIYKGINDQDGAAQIATQAAKLLLSSNKIISKFENTLGKDVFYFLNPRLAFVFSVNQDDYIIYLKYLEDKYTGKELYCVDCCLFDPYMFIESTVYTDNRLIASMYGKSVKLLPSTKAQQFLIINLMRMQKLTFTNDTSLAVGRFMYDQYMKDNPPLI